MISKKRHTVNRQKRQLKPPRYTIRKDSLDRRYAIDKRTGQRVSVYKAEKERQQRRKAVKAIPRYIIYKDSLDRRYAIDKRTGQRVSVYKAEKERQQRRKAVKAIPRYIPPKPRKPVKTKSKTRSEAAKRGWVTRRERLIVPISVFTPIEDLVPVGITPIGVTMVPLFVLRERMEMYPNVKRAVENAFTRLQYQSWKKRYEIIHDIPQPKLTGKALIQARLRDIIASRIQDAGDVERVLAELWVELDGEYSLRELYETHFSPEVA
jgi:hypothetical protein